MKIIEYSQIPQDELSIYKELSNKIIEKIKPSMLHQYFWFKKNDFFIDNLNSQLPYLLWATKGNLENKYILDLGCGSNNKSLESIGFTDTRVFEAWMCRALLKLGAKPIGVDYGRNWFEKFEHYRINFLKKDSLKIFHTNSIDIAHSHLLFTSIFLKKNKIQGNELKEILIPQLERIVRQEGLFIYGENIE